MQPSFRSRFHATAVLLLAAYLVLFAMEKARADVNKDRLTGKGGVSLPLDQVMHEKHERGPVVITIPVAEVYGLGNAHSPSYCSPSIRADNTSNQTIETLSFGIEYQTGAGQMAGSSVTQFNKLKTGQHIMQQFYQLAAPDCKGLQGKLTVLHCIYASGEDCSLDVQAIAFGPIPLHMNPH